MNAFVSACRREWARLGVPEADANEMASDLEADLADAAADGVSPEEVLGNGYFDPAAFASSWATARGVVDPLPGPSQGPVRRGWVQLSAAAVCVLAMLVGVAALAGGRQGTAVAAVASRRQFLKPVFVPGIQIKPFMVAGTHHDPGLALFGAFLLLAGLTGLALVLWLWRPWSGRRRTQPPDSDVGMPSFL